jgi:hypothetical protein
MASVLTTDQLLWILLSNSLAYFSGDFKFDLAFLSPYCGGNGDDYTAYFIQKRKMKLVKI